MTESPLTLFGRGLASQARCCREMSASASRRDNTDRSLARSATESVPRKNRPVGYGMIGRPGTAKGVLEDQDSNTFLRAENAMNVQARESVCHGKKLYRRPEIIQHTFFKFFYSRFRHSNHRIGAHTMRESHRTLRDGSFGVALSQALRARLRSVLSLRDTRLSRRDGTIVAWHEVP